MRNILQQTMLLCCLALGWQTAWADDDPNGVVFQETFDQTNGTGGRDGKYTGSIANGAIKYDNTGWADAVKCGGAYQCVKFGTSSANGVLTTPEIALGGASHVVLTFSAAGWGDSNKNKLTVTANEGVTLTGDNSIAELENEEWKRYTVLITATGSSLQLTFTGKRGFIDDVVVRTITTVPAPTLTDSHSFFPLTTEEEASETVLLTPANYVTAYYTTDGSTPSDTNGTEALLETGIHISGTTTVKAVAYVGDMQSEVVSRTYTQGMTVNGIAGFKALAEGTEARLFLPDDANARVLHAHDGKLMYLRDNSGTLCFDFGETATFNPTPVHNQHVAGWIVGRKQTEKGLLKLVATENTNTTFLALAAPVTEAPTAPTVVTPDGEGRYDLSGNAGDWVTVSDARIGTDLAIENTFHTEKVAGQFEQQQLIDASGIVTESTDGGQTVAPVYYNDIKPVVYVVDEDKDFVSPAGDVADATVRLKRTLSKDYWNTFTVPFDMAAFDGEIRSYDQLDGTTMHFGKAEQIEAGKPYLVKPREDIVNPVFSDVTLSATPAATVNHGGDYYFVGTYSPATLAADKSELLLTSGGQLVYPQDEADRQLKGMRAYFQALNGSEAMTLNIDGDTNSLRERGIVNSEENATATEWYTLDGRKLSGKPTQKGVYINGGRKVVVK